MSRMAASRFLAPFGTIQNDCIHAPLSNVQSTSAPAFLRSMSRPLNPSTMSTSPPRKRVWIWAGLLYHTLTTSFRLSRNRKARSTSSG